MLKRMILFLFALAIVCTACGAPESPPPESPAPPPVSQPEPEPEAEPEAALRTDFFPLQEKADGILDPEPVEALCAYLVENLAKDEYTCIYPDYAYDSTGNKHYAQVCAPDPSRIEELLGVYTGSWAPVSYVSLPFTLAQAEQAGADLTGFLAQHPEIDVVGLAVSEGEIWVKTAKEDQLLNDFAAAYPIEGIIRPMVHTTVGMNPD